MILRLFKIGNLKRALLVFSIIMFLLVNSISAQSSKKTVRLFEKAVFAYQNGNNSGAITLAKQALKTDNFHFDSHLLLSDIYNSLDSVKAEINHLEFVWNNNSHANGLVGFRLGEAFFQSGNYLKSLEILEKALEISGLPQKREKAINKIILSCRFAIEAIQNPVADEAVKLSGGINTDRNEYWPSISIDGKSMVFTRLEKNDLNIQQEDFFISNFDENKWNEAIPINEINTEENEGAQTLTADGTILFFAACNRADGFGSCDIYFSRKVNGSWEKPRNAGKPVSSGSWESQPSVTANGNYLYFSSNRNGGKGKMDIWRCRLSGFDDNGNPRWGKPENLGDKINTPGNENSPFIHFNGKDLYFSSDELVGMGGADIFYTELNGENRSNPVNLGFPINTNNDEQGLVIDASGKKAFYVSDRDGSLDIFSFNLYEEIQPDPVTYIRGKVIDSISKQPLIAEIEFTIIGSSYSEKVESDVNGNFLLALPLLKNYAFNVLKDGYLFYSDAFELENVYSQADPFILNVELQPIIEGAKMVLNNIYFETDSYEIKPESEPELKKLIELLQNNPGIAVEIEGNTDNVGSEEYNQLLSEKRAKAVVDYLIETGINVERLSYKGFGFSNPLAGNNSEEGRRKNRRTEIRIIKI